MVRLVLGKPMSVFHGSSGHPSGEQIPSTDFDPVPTKRLLPAEPVAGVRVKQSRAAVYFDQFKADGVLQERITIGRSPLSDIVLPSHRISRFHCVLERLDGYWTIRDTDSLNGTVITRHQDPIVHSVRSDAATILSLNMKVVVPDFELLPITASGHIGLFAWTQQLFRALARREYFSAREAGDHIGCSRTTIYAATRIKQHLSKKR